MCFQFLLRTNKDHLREGHFDWVIFLFLFENLRAAERGCLTVTNAALAGSGFFQPASGSIGSLNVERGQTVYTHTHTKSLP